MSSSTTGSTRRASSSKTTSATRSASSQTSLSTRSSSATSTSSIPTTVPSPTAAITHSVPVASSTADANAGQKSATPVVAIVVLVVLLVLGLVAAGVAFFICKRKKRKQRSAEEPHVVSREPKRQDSYPHDTADPFARSSKASDDDIKSTIYSVDSALDFTARAKARSSRASSSIFLSDDAMTITSRSNFLRPVSLGEPIALRNVQPASGQMPPLPERPLLNTTAESSKAVSDSSSVSSQDADDRRSTHIFTITRSATPEPILPVPPVPARLPSLAPIPPIRYSLFDEPSRRVSTNTLAPARYDDPSRPQSMVSVYSTAEAGDAGMLSPDVQEVLSRLKKRISTPWSINSVETSRISVARASDEA